MTTTSTPARRFDPRWVPLIVTTIGTFMSILDSTIVNIALPNILKEFDTSLASGQLVITSYLMALAVIVPTSGWLGERVGMKRLYIITLFLFTAGSALCGLAWNIQSLIFFRILQGFGGGMLQPLSMALVFRVITPLERPKFMALLGLPVLIAPLMGPTVGGYLVEYASWRTVFLINIPIGLLDIVLAYFILKETPLKRESKLDVRGLMLATIAFPCILLGLTFGTKQGWTSPAVTTLLAVGATALAMFIRHELRHRDPMLRLRLFADPLFRTALGIQWIGFFSLFGLNFMMPLFLQQARGLSPSEAGEVLLPMGIVAFLAMNGAGRLYNRFGPRFLATIGLVVLAGTTFAWSRIGTDTSLVFVVIVASLRGLGLGFFAQTVQLAAYNAISPDEIPRATALVNMCQRMVGALTTAVLTTVLGIGLMLANAPDGAHIGDGSASQADTLYAFHVAFLVMTGVSLFGVILATKLRDRVLEAAKMEKASGAGPVVKHVSG